MRYSRCNHCSKKFQSEDALAKHITRKHTLEQTLYTCAVCQKKFRFKGSLTDHLKIHTNNDIRFECTQCPCFFKYQGHLKTHMKEAHTKEKQFHQCQQCPKKFEAKAVLRHHERTIHSAVLVLHKCSFCPRVYNSKNSLKWHVHINHNKDFQRSKCPYCPADFKWPHHLKVHIKKAHIEKGYAPSDLIKTGLSTIRRKTNDCIVCSEKFEKKLDLMLHLKKTHKQDIDIYRCCICEAVFSLRNSMKLHLDEHRRKKTNTNHKCDQCYPESNPTALMPDVETEVEVTDGRTEVEKEIVDFEISLMEDEEIRPMIKNRVRKEIYAKRTRNYYHYEDKIPIKYNESDEYIDIKEDNLSVTFEDNHSDNMHSDNEVVLSEPNTFDICKKCNLNIGNCDCSTSNDKKIINKQVFDICKQCNLNIENCDCSTSNDKKIINKQVKVCVKRLNESEITQFNNEISLAHICNKCNCCFSLSNSLDEHMRLSHGRNETGTDSEDTRESYDKEIKAKGEQTNQKTTYKCKLCGDYFDTPLNLGRHIRLTHRTEYKCSICNLSFKTKLVYANHVRVKHSSKKTIKTSPRKSNVKCVSPKKLKIRNKAYECGKCELFFPKKLALLRHISDVHLAHIKRNTKFSCNS